MKAIKDVDIEEFNRSAAATWDAKPAIRAEFGGRKDLFLTYQRAVAQGLAGAATYQAVGPVTRRQVADDAAAAYAAAIASGDEAAKERTLALYVATHATRIAASPSR